MADIKLGNVPTSTINDTDNIIIAEGEAPRKVSYSSVKQGILGTETKTTTATTVNGAINELDADIGDKTQLPTVDKTSLVNSIIEVNTSLLDMTKISNLKTYTGLGQLGFTSNTTFATLIQAMFGSSFLMFDYRGTPTVTDSVPYAYVTVQVYKYTNYRNFIRLLGADGREWTASYDIGNNVITPWLETTASDSGWLDLPLQSGIIVDTGLTPQYRKIGNQVFIVGSIKGVTSANSVVATLPVGFRPSKNIYYSNHKSGNAFNAMAIYISGTINIMANSAGTFSANDYNTIGINFCLN